ncbi:MAG: hypothetical protein ABI680_17760 [Chthoniobacteraceae bacterium]
MAAACAQHRVPLRAADCFLLASDDLMRRTGQGPQVSLSLLALESMPSLEQLRSAGQRVVQKHPLLVATLHRSWRTWLPYWKVPKPPEAPLPLWIWNSPTAAFPMSLFQKAAEQPLDHEGLPFRARLHVFKMPDGTAYAGLAWSHLILDGKGAELLLTEIARLSDGDDEPLADVEMTAPALTIKEQFAKSRAAIHRFSELKKFGVISLGGPRPKSGRCSYQVITLSENDSSLLAERVAQMTGALFPLAFYVACAARAHDHVFTHRQRQPRGYIASVPIQTRKHGSRGPLFHNHVSVLFFGAMREELSTIEAAATTMKRQFAEMSRARLDESFRAMLGLMMRLPSRWFMRLVRSRFKGEVASFYHSHTGPFAPELETFAGARITNAFHLPCLGAPPSTGIFFSERGCRTSVTFTWRDGLNPEERRAWVGQTLEDLLGAPRPEMIDVGI